MIPVCVQEHKRIEEHVLQICSRTRSDTRRPALQFKQSELGLTSVDGAVRWAYEIGDGVETAAGAEQYIAELECHGMHLGFCRS